MNKLLKNVYVINLERSKDRLQKIDTNLKKYGIKYNRFDAIDGNKLTKEEINNITTSSCRYILCNKSIIGCAMSHITLWSNISKSQDKWHLILEDDAEITPKTIDFLNRLNGLSIMNDDDIIISLSCIGVLCSGKSQLMIDNLLLEPILPLGMSGYLITKDTAKKLYDYFTKYKINYHVDAQLAFNTSALGIKHLVPTEDVISIQGYNDSTIGTRLEYLLARILDFLGLSKLAWYLSEPLITINMTVSINGYIILFIILLIINILLIGSILLYFYLMIEFIIFLIMI